MSTSFGRTSVVAVLASAMAIFALVAKGGWARLLSLAALIGTGLALALSGHASAAEPQWVTRPMVFLHGVGIAFWTGALIPLGLALARRTPESGYMLRRFSNTIPLVLALLIIAGMVLAVVQVRIFRHWSKLPTGPSSSQNWPCSSCFLHLPCSIAYG